MIELLQEVPLRAGRGLRLLAGGGDSRGRDARPGERCPQAGEVGGADGGPEGRSRSTPISISWASGRPSSSTEIVEDDPEFVAAGRTVGQALDVDGETQITGPAGIRPGQMLDVEIVDALDYDLVAAGLDPPEG